MTDVSDIVHLEPEEKFTLTRRNLPQFIDKAKRLLGQKDSSVFVYYLVNGVYVPHFLNPRRYCRVDHVLSNKVDILFNDEMRETLWIDKSPVVGFTMTRGLLAVRIYTEQERRYVVRR